MHGIAPPSPCAKGSSQRSREGKSHVIYKLVSHVSSLFLPAPASHEVRSKETAGCGNSDGEAWLGRGAWWDARGEARGRGRKGAEVISIIDSRRKLIIALASDQELGRVWNLMI